MTIDEDPFKDLEARNRKLQSELDAYKKAAEKNQQIKWWTAKKVTSIFLGKNLDSAIKQGITEFSEEKKISKDTLSDLIAALIRRVVRVGLIAFFLALLPTAILLMQTYLLNQQNKRIDIQNDRLKQQTHLQEAERRSALIFLYGNLLEVIDREIRENEKATGKRNLSPQTIGQIVALSQRLQPYRYLHNDALIAKPLSPERAQLLISLVESSLDSLTYAKIFESAVFSYADLSNVNFEGKNLTNVNLGHSHITNSTFRRAKLELANLQHVVLDSVDFVKASLKLANFNNAEISSTNFQFTNLQSSLFESSRINESRFDFSDLRKASFENSKLQYTSFKSAKLQTTQFIFTDSFPRAKSIMLENLEGSLVEDTSIVKIDSMHHSRTWFKKAILNEVNFREANLTNAYFNSTQIRNSCFDQVNLSGTSFDSSVINNTSFNFAFLNGTSFYKMSMSSLNFEKAVLPLSVIQLREEGMLAEIRRFGQYKLSEVGADTMFYRSNFKDNRRFQKLLIDKILLTDNYEIDSINHIYLSKARYDENENLFIPPFWWESFVKRNFKNKKKKNLILLQSRNK